MRTHPDIINNRYIYFDTSGDSVDTKILYNSINLINKGNDIICKDYHGKVYSNKFFPYGKIKNGLTKINYPQDFKFFEGINRRNKY